MAPRPDPYAQITNPLHAGWGAPMPAAAPMPAPAPAEPTVTRRSRWPRRVAVVVLLALIAAGAWWQRARIEDVVDQVGDRFDGESSMVMSPPRDGEVPETPDPGQDVVDPPS